MSLDFRSADVLSRRIYKKNRQVYVYDVRWVYKWMRSHVAFAKLCVEWICVWECLRECLRIPEWVVAAVGVRSYTAGVSGGVVFCIYALQRLEATVSSNHRFSAQLTLVCVVDQCVYVCEVVFWENLVRFLFFVSARVRCISVLFDLWTQMIIINKLSVSVVCLFTCGNLKKRTLLMVFM